MSIEKLRATVSELEQELRALPTVDAEARSVLEEVVREIRAALRDSERGESQRRSPIAGLKDSVEKFEGSHPALTGILGRLIDGLAQLGI
jgi:septal ring factor EnvC (AmiA/AmiB activator)